MSSSESHFAGEVMVRSLFREDWAASGFGLGWIRTCLVGGGPASSEIDTGASCIWPFHFYCLDSLLGGEGQCFVLWEW